MTKLMHPCFVRGIVVDAPRLAAFGDAVFAIAITLLALEITVPEGLSDSGVNKALHEALPAVGAYLLSFVVIGSLWMTQHMLFKLITGVDRCLLYLYFTLLAVVAALPFPTRMISEYGGTATATWLYAVSITVAMTLLCAMYVRLWFRPQLASLYSSPGHIVKSIRRNLAMILVFASSIPVAFLSPSLAKYWWILALPARRIFPEPPLEERTSSAEPTTNS